MSNPNCSLEDLRPSPVQVGSVGLFEGGGRARCGLFRAEHSCRMRRLSRPFCTVCQQRIRSMLAPFGGAMSWQTKGNRNTNPATDYFGTGDAQPLVLRTDGTERARVTATGAMGVGTPAPLFRLHSAAPGNFGGEDGNGIAQAGGVPVVAQSDGTAFGILNAQGRPAFALNIEGNTGQPNNRGVPIFYDRYDGNWRPALALKNGRVGIGTADPLFALEVRGDVQDFAAVSCSSPGGSASLVGLKRSGQGDGFGVGGEVNGFGAGVIGVNHGNGAGVQGSTENTTLTSFGVVGFIGPGFVPPAAALPGGIGVVGVSPSTGVAGATTGVGAIVSNGTEGFHSGPNPGAGVHARTTSPAPAVALYAEGALAGEFLGDVLVQGTLAASGKAFRIDHPLDPANRYLSHASVESPDQLTVYSGDLVTDHDGRAEIALPDYFEALNRDFRYQLTVVGSFAQAVVEREIEGNRFLVRTDKPGVKVCWQVTGTRDDAYARSRPLQVEEDKPKGERGRYLHPEVHGQLADVRPLNWRPSSLPLQELQDQPALASLFGGPPLT